MNNQGSDTHMYVSEQAAVILQTQEHITGLLPSLFLALKKKKYLLEWNTKIKTTMPNFSLVRDFSDLG